MPLLDHFRPPLTSYFPTESILFAWTTALTDWVFKAAPEHFTAEQIVTPAGGSLIDIDDSTPDCGPVAAAANAAIWKPTLAHGVLPGNIPPAFEVQVLLHDGGAHHTGTIFLVAPENKADAQRRSLLVAKLVALIQTGVAVCFIDIVPSGNWNLHERVVDQLGQRTVDTIDDGAACHAVAYRPVRRDDRVELEYWIESFRIGDRLPTIPLRLAADLFLPVDFESTYMEVCRTRRVFQVLSRTGGT